MFFQAMLRSKTGQEGKELNRDEANKVANCFFIPHPDQCKSTNQNKT
jgi:hypothetical protein